MSAWSCSYVAKLAGERARALLSRLWGFLGRRAPAEDRRFELRLIGVAGEGRLDCLLAVSALMTSIAGIDPVRAPIVVCVAGLRAFREKPLVKDLLTAAEAESIAQQFTAAGAVVAMIGPEDRMLLYPGGHRISERFGEGERYGG